MCHFLAVPVAVPGLPGRVQPPAPRGRLEGPPRPLPPLSLRQLRAGAGTVDLAAIAGPADHDQGVAARAAVLAGGGVERRVRPRGLDNTAASGDDPREGRR